MAMYQLELGGKLVKLYGLPKETRSEQRTHFERSGPVSEVEAASEVLVAGSGAASSNSADLLRLPVVFLNTVAGEGEAVWTACRKLGAPDFVLAIVERVNWSDDMTPWPSEAQAKWEAKCNGRADLYLEKLEGVILPGVLEALRTRGIEPSWVGLAGYSLGGLFALYTLWKTDAFTRVASASGSLWYPDFPEYCASHPLAGVPERVYLSLGSKESRSKRTRDLDKRTEAIGELLRTAGAETTFELNPGNHIHEADRRMAKGILWLLKD